MNEHLREGSRPSMQTAVGDSDKIRAQHLERKAILVRKKARS